MRVAGARWMLAVLVLAAAAWITRSNLTEAFVAAPPYYSRTTNMDKWEDPVPMPFLPLRIDGHRHHRRVGPVAHSAQIVRTDVKKRDF